jgi:hypothetical protein
VWVERDLSAHESQAFSIQDPKAYCKCYLYQHISISVINIESKINAEKRNNSKSIALGVTAIYYYFNLSYTQALIKGVTLVF